MRACACLLSLAALAAADWAEVQERFKGAYRDGAPEAARREALLELARADLPEAAEALFAVWHALEEETKRLRREIFELRAKIRRARADPRAAAEVPALDARDIELNTRLGALELERSAILSGVRGFKAPPALDWLRDKGLASARSPALLRVAAGRVGGAADGGMAALLDALAKAREPGQAVALLDALAENAKGIGVPGLPTVLRRLSDRDAAVRAAAARAVARSALPDGVGPLVRQVQREAPRSRAERELLDALRLLTGANPGDDPRVWAAWWRDHEAEVMGGKLALGIGKPARVTTDQGNFYGIPQIEQRIVYVLDRSGSMVVSMEEPRFVAGGAVAARDDEDSRFDAAVRELLRAAKSLRKDASYTLVAYSDHAEAVLGEDLEPATSERHAQLTGTLARMGPEGQTNIYEALDLALRLAGVHPEEPPGPAKADAIYLLTDGAPTDAKGKIEDPERTLEAAREWNALRRIAIHTIGIGAEHNSAFLRQLAEEHGGEYYAVVPKKKVKKPDGN